MFDQRTHLSTYPIHISSVSLKDMKNHMKSHTKSWFIPLYGTLNHQSFVACVPRGNICCWSAVPSWARWLRRSQSMEHVVKSWENGGRNKEWSGIIGIWMGISPTIWINIIHGIILNFVMFLSSSYIWSWASYYIVQVRMKSPNECNSTQKTAMSRYKCYWKIQVFIVCCSECPSNKVVTLW